MKYFNHALMPAIAAGLLICAAAPAGAQDYTTRYVTTTTTTYNAPVVVEQPTIVDMGMARDRALRAEPGRIERSGLSENSAGEPIYVFDIRQGDMSHIVRVDALTGEVIGRDIANPRSDRYDGRFGPMN